MNSSKSFSVHQRFPITFRKSDAVFNLIDEIWRVICSLEGLTHWGRVTHICVSDLTSIGSDNGLSPGRRQAIIRTNAGILLTRPLGTYFSEFLVEILMFSFKKMHLKVSSAKWRLFRLGLNELRPPGLVTESEDTEQFDFDCGSYNIYCYYWYNIQNILRVNLGCNFRHNYWYSIHKTPTVVIDGHTM